jgi:hypothetical protein
MSQELADSLDLQLAQPQHAAELHTKWGRGVNFPPRIAIPGPRLTGIAIEAGKIQPPPGAESARLGGECGRAGVRAGG